MGSSNHQLSEAQQKFIQKQHIFFVASAPLHPEGHVNVSPKGLDTFRILSPSRVAYLDFAGSGNETSAHILENQRITILFCSFAKNPMILRLYGKGSVIKPSQADWDATYALFNTQVHCRQLFIIDIHRIQSSCGYGIPFYEYQGERSTLTDWIDKKGPEGIDAYIQKNNLQSLDGLPTHLGNEKKG
ncbi:MAG TPA: pyridoxamine 5'-phosphate oxidase family protein [Chitinophagaceae bacterium]|nr:pyridoxamine 5'-phosphate oxidase family protein [Chitinophagaceae bacterium]